MSSVIDHRIFEQRLGFSLGNSDFHLHKTECCEGCFVEDLEIMTAYYDPADLSRTLLLERGVACPICDAANWNYSEVLETVEVPPTWKWACTIK